MIKNVARDRCAFPECFGNALFMTFVSGLPLFAVVLVACTVLLPNVSPLVIALLVASNILLDRFLDVAACAFQSVEMLGWTATLNILPSLTRLAGVAVIVLLNTPTLGAWSIAYFLTGSISSAVGVICVLLHIGKPRITLRRIPGELAEGFYFAAGLSAQNIYENIDKTMLARMASLEATGIYAAAYRLTEVAFVPVRSLLSAAYPGFFRCGQQGILGTFAYARRLLPRPLTYAVLVSFLILGLSPLVTHVLGQEYANTHEALSWLAILPVLKTLNYFAADSLTGAGHQGLRTAVHVGVAVFTVLINFWLLPVYSWRGAAWSSLVSNGLLAASLWSCVWVLSVRTAIQSPEMLPPDQATLREL
jgi:O-antigen/teichoic acid export membrane protein